MARNVEYTREYFDIMDGLGGDIVGRRNARDYMKSSTAIVHHEVVGSSFVPRLYNRKTYEVMERASTTVHSILCKVMAHYLEDPAYRTVFSFDPRLEELILLPRGYDALLPFARVDIFLNEDDYTIKFCEFNADGSSGMNEDREIVNSIKGSASFREFSRRHPVSPSDLFTPWVEEFLEIYRSYDHAVKHPRIAICDYLAHGIVDEFKMFCRIFDEYGIECRICDVCDLSFDGEELCDAEGARIDAIWRRSVTNDVIDHWDESQDLIEAVRFEKVALIGSFAGHIVHDKQIFQVLHKPETAAFLTDEEVEFIKQTIPFTAFLREDSIDLARIVSEKDKWIIKPSDHYGADQVFAGVAFEMDEWRKMIGRYADNASGTTFIVQEYCTPFKTLILPPDHSIETYADEEVPREGELYNNLSGLYLFNGRFSGVFSRLGPLPTISKDMRGITAATIWIDE